MKRQINQSPYPLGLVVFGLLLAIYKAISLTIEMGADWPRFIVIAGLDGLFLGLLFMIALLACNTGHKWFRGALYLLLVVMTSLYFVDSFVLLALDEHARLFEISRYTPEWGVVMSFFDTVTYIAVLLFGVSLFVFSAYTPAIRIMAFGLLLASLVAAGASFVYAPRSLQFYAMINPLQLADSIGSQRAAEIYSVEDIEFYAGLKREATAVPASKPDIILLIVESLSSINSEKLSGNPGFLEDFDRLAQEGVLFRNFFANHQASEGGLIALLGGFPPIHFPTATPYMFDEFAIQKSVIADYREQGYYAEFLTNADLAFIGLDGFLSALGLDRSRGRDDIDEMSQAPRIVQDAPSDKFLYRAAMSSVRQGMSFEQPYLLTIATTSTHLPYSHPEGGPDTPEAIWAWSMQQLLGFYDGLSESGYFDHGILLITGDHRQMRPVRQAETALYGDSARARVPLLVIGTGYPRGLIDERFFQQSDLLRMLGRIHDPELPLSPHPLWVERYNRKYGRIELIGSLTVFDEAEDGRNGYQLTMTGNRIDWPAGKPGFAREVETRIHVQRSNHQRVRQQLQ